MDFDSVQDPRLHWWKGTGRFRPQRHWTRQVGRFPTAWKGGVPWLLTGKMISFQKELGCEQVNKIQLDQDGYWDPDEQKWPFRETIQLALKFRCWTCGMPHWSRWWPTRKSKIWSKSLAWTSTKSPPAQILRLDLEKTSTQQAMPTRYRLKQLSFSEKKKNNTSQI